MLVRVAKGLSCAVSIVAVAAGASSCSDEAPPERPRVDSSQLTILTGELEKAETDLHAAQSALERVAGPEYPALSSAAPDEVSDVAQGTAEVLIAHLDDLVVDSDEPSVALGTLDTEALGRAFAIAVKTDESTRWLDENLSSSFVRLAAQAVEEPRQTPALVSLGDTISAFLGLEAAGHVLTDGAAPSELISAPGGWVAWHLAAAQLANGTSLPRQAQALVRGGSLPPYGEMSEEDLSLLLGAYSMDARFLPLVSGFDNSAYMRAAEAAT
jgi:hypothetical protein